MIRVVEERCQFSSDSKRGTVVLESDTEGPNFQKAFDELGSPDAKNMALAYAQENGCVPAYLNGLSVSPYPVNGEGLSLDQVKDEHGEPLPATHARMRAYRYQVAIPVCAKQ